MVGGLHRVSDVVLRGAVHLDVDKEARLHHGERIREIVVEKGVHREETCRRVQDRGNDLQRVVKKNAVGREKGFAMKSGCVWRRAIQAKHGTLEL